MISSELLESIGFDVAQHQGTPLKIAAIIEHLDRFGEDERPGVWNRLAQYIQDKDAWQQAGHVCGFKVDVTAEGAFLVKNGDFHLADVADYIQGKHRFLFFKDNGDLRAMNGDGVFIEDGEQLVATELTKMLSPDDWSSHKVNETTNYIKAREHPSKTVLANHDIQWTHALIPCANGVLNTETGQLEPYENCTQIFFGKLPVSYDPTAKCPQFDTFIREMFPKDEERATVQEHFGMWIVPDRRFVVGLFVIGPTHTGKSTFLKVTKSFFGELESNISLDQLINNRFAPSGLYGKYLNTYSQMPTDEGKQHVLRDEGRFLTLLGLDPIYIESKGKNGFSWLANTCQMHMGNKAPKTEGHGDEFFVRIHLVHTTTVSHLGAAADKFLLDKLTTPEELSGILNWALEGRDRLLKNGDFSYPYSIDETRMDWEAVSDNISKFCGEMLEASKDDMIENNHLFIQYETWCDINHESADYRDVFFKELRKHYQITTVKMPGDKRRAGTKGIKLKKELDPQTKLPRSDAGG